ncbi:MAG: HTTM domain-containing protein [Kofleriaceae bacterium]|nr:HTTM domain-containing protein [Kofleriaceae bacterium]
MAKKRKHGGKKTAAKPAPKAQGLTSGSDEQFVEDKPSRGKQRREQARVARASTPQAEPPAFWFGFEVTWAKLALGRFVLFSLLALDALLQISHAPRYGAGNFNVAQLPLLDFIAPGRVAYLVGQLVCSWLFVLAACGVATRIALPLVTAIYGWLYFGSHLDSYQHHYLVWLILLLACFVPWQRPPDAEPATRVRSWALRLILVQLGILYFWAAVSKLDGAWLDGRTLGGQIHGSLRSLIDSTVHIRAASILVVATEVALAFTVWRPRTWRYAAPLGLALHIGILASGLEIGLFAWLMIGLYIFIVPDVVWVWLAERAPIAAARRAATTLAGYFTGTAAIIWWVLAAAIAALLAVVSRFDNAPLVGLLLLAALLAITATLRGRHRVAWIATAHLLAFGLWTVVDRTTAEPSDYYRLWGGSARRLGDLATSEYAYRRMTEIAPNEGTGHYQLGRLLLARNASEQGLAELHRAQDLEPMKARSYTAEARWLASNGQNDAAIAKAREATIIEPGDSEARSLLNSLLGTK